MKKIYTLPIAFILAVFAGCTKDILKSYEERIIGTWELYDVDKRGFGGDTGNLPFRDGVFTFQDNGGLLYVNSAGTQYDGSWDISSNWISGYCTVPNEYSSCSDREVNSLQVTAVDFNNQNIITENFEEIIFTSKDKFKGYIYSGFHTYVFHFRRQ